MSSPCDHHVGTFPIHVCTSCFLAKFLLGPTRVGEQGWVDKFRARGWVGQRGDSFGKLLFPPPSEDSFPDVDGWLAQSGSTRTPK